MPDRIHPSLLRIFQRSKPDDIIAFIDESYVTPEEDFSESFYILVGTAIKFEHLGNTRSLLRETAQSNYWHTTESMRSCDGRKKAFDHCNEIRILSMLVKIALNCSLLHSLRMSLL